MSVTRRKVGKQQRQMQDLKRKSTEELKAFVEISCTTSPNHLVSVRKAYCLLLNSSLAEYTVGSEEAQLHKYDGIFGFTKETIKRKGDEDTRRHCMQSIVHGVMPDDIARLLNRACYYSAVRFMAYIHREYKKTMENEMVVEVFKKLQNPYEVGIMEVAGGTTEVV
ncbi:hypothetical protein IGI04_040500 [Brassica rapa subsp. trilocularis]|uniref:Uncharacterized protein n=1 Tax=Brassica rapa subsp. trilocularis TaxID=1813537 RepID=A0ABQ7KNV7_BRACM|nr:hypothetical protein IGI04_040500 [Brassica rapa subsp. trilocularis]